MNRSFIPALLSVMATTSCYALALQLHRKWRAFPPIVGACIPIMAALWLLRVPYAEYNRGGTLLTWWLGPATVALAVPMYRNGLALRGMLPRLSLVVLAGSITGMVSAGVTAWLLHAPLPVIMSTVPKSVTTPIAIEVSRQLRGIPQITIAMVILTGVLGATCGTYFLKLARIRNDRAIGAAIGTSSHGIGTASLIRQSELRAAVSSWAMAAAGVFTSILGASLSFLLR
ncbi:LrgB family protein [Occallatibacter savannae]|uniref:LrgB family protein n=1 Tax=Occallatibacter savannae TaxID=1002691 RepID=UPI000D689288|nr:LrgB family protein [Occallatibacter savannae]